jgi:hypothetical protein
MTDLRVRLMAVEVWCSVASEIDAAMAWAEARDTAYASPAGRVVIEEILNLANYPNCAGCDTVACTARPVWYPIDRQSDQTNYLCTGVRYLLEPLCADCAGMHDTRFNGVGVPKTGGYFG